MRDADTTLAIVEDRGKRGLPLENVYRRLYNPDLYLRAYGRLYRNEGAMTKGTTTETVDGMSQRKIEDLIEQLRHERFRWTPVRRTYIPKKDGKQRPLGIPSWSDKLLQEVMRSIMEAYYEPQFSPTSHGFRPERGCHTALKDIFHGWTGVRWFIEGDIKGCFDNIDHNVLVATLGEKIHDGRFLNLMCGLLKAGYLEQWDYRPTLSGTPQGGIVSPLLANIYLDKLDEFVEQTLIPEFTRGTTRRKNRAYENLTEKIRRLKKKGAAEATLKPLRREAHRLGARDPLDPGYRRLRYIRYADDFLLGFSGPKAEAEEIKARIGTFLRDYLKLELSPAKTLITHAATEKARFLGYDVGVNNAPFRRGMIRLRMPLQKLEDKVNKYLRDGKPIHRPEIQTEDDFSIVERYGAEYRGFVQYYAFAENRFWLHKLHWAMRTSLLKTLASKHKTTVSKVARKYQAEHYHWGRTLACLEVKRERPGKEPLIARFGGLRLCPDPFLKLIDLPLDRDRRISRNELVSRLLADTCEICGSREMVQVHHVRKLADLKVKGRKEKPVWKQMMATRKRKTLVVCKACHEAIHAGRPTRAPASENQVNGM